MIFVKPFEVKAFRVAKLKPYESRILEKAYMVYG
jgi:hypothetical protein